MHEGSQSHTFGCSQMALSQAQLMSYISDQRPLLVDNWDANAILWRSLTWTVPCQLAPIQDSYPSCVKITAVVLTLSTSPTGGIGNGSSGLVGDLMVWEGTALVLKVYKRELWSQCSSCSFAFGFSDLKLFGCWNNFFLCLICIYNSLLKPKEWNLLGHWVLCALNLSRPFIPSLVRNSGIGLSFCSTPSLSKILTPCTPQNCSFLTLFCMSHLKTLHPGCFFYSQFINK